MMRRVAGTRLIPRSAHDTRGCFGPNTGCPSQHGAEALNAGDRQQIVVHVDAVTLRDGAVGRCGLARPAQSAARRAPEFQSYALTHPLRCLRSPYPVIRASGSATVRSSRK